MKRDPRLRELSVQHHHALVLARALTQLVEAGQLGEAGRRLAERFEHELEPHFAVEEALLLPALRAVGEVALADSTLADHTAMRGLRAAASAGGREALVEFAARLTDHVRFEERELFPCCEARLPPAVLAAVAERSRFDA